MGGCRIYPRKKHYITLEWPLVELRCMRTNRLLDLGHQLNMNPVSTHVNPIIFLICNNERKIYHKMNALQMMQLVDSPRSREILIWGMTHPSFRSTEAQESGGAIFACSTSTPVRLLSRYCVEWSSGTACRH